MQCPRVRVCNCKPGFISRNAGINPSTGCGRCSCRRIKTAALLEAIASPANVVVSDDGTSSKCQRWKVCNCKPGYVSKDAGINPSTGCGRCSCRLIKSSSRSQRRTEIGIFSADSAMNSGAKSIAPYLTKPRGPPMMNPYTESGGEIYPWHTPAVRRAPRPSVWVVIPTHNSGAWIGKCIASILSQQFSTPGQNAVDSSDSPRRTLAVDDNLHPTLVHIVVGDDGSTDGTVAEARAAWSARPVLNLSTTTTSYADKYTFKVLDSQPRHGLEHTLHHLFSWVSEHGYANDVVVVLDGIARFSGDAALAIIADMFWKKKCWISHGSLEKAKVIDDEPANIPLFVFRLHLLRTLGNIHGSDGNWIQTDDDDGLLNKMIKIAGMARVCFIPKLLNMRGKLDGSVNNISSKLVNPVSEGKASVEPIHIIMCNSNREAQLGAVIFALYDQKQLHPGTLVHVHIWNNNANHTMLDRVLARVQAGADPARLQIDVRHSETNVFAWGKLILADELTRSIPLDYIMFLDDDLFLHPTFVSELWAAREPRGFLGWYGKRWRPTRHFQYSTITLTQILKGRGVRPEVTEFSSIATGGSVLDVSVFSYSMFWQCPIGFQGVQDMWLSYIAQSHLGYRLGRLNTNPNIPLRATNERGSEDENRMLWMLRAHGWQV